MCSLMPITFTEIFQRGSVGCLKDMYHVCYKELQPLCDVDAPGLAEF